MAITCPSCQAKIDVKGAKPGRYTPKCPHCGMAFSLTVPTDPNAAIVVRQAAPPAAATPPPKPARPAQPVDATLPSSAPPARPPAKKTPPPPPPADATMPSAGPDVTAPSASPDVTAPSAGPDVTAPSAGPDVTAPSAGPDVTAPSAGPDVTAPSAGPDVTAPSRGAAATAAGQTQAAPAGVDVPEKLGGYEIAKELGRGGMGSVYLGRQVSLDRKVAVKVMKPEWSRNPVFLSRFTREAYAAAQLVHHNVVQIYDIGAEEELNFFGMEFVDGTSLGDLVKQEGKLDAEQAAGYILQAARGLKFAHDRGMIHRDIKPDNLMLNSEGIVKVADLGLVKTPGSDEAEQEQSAAEPVALPDDPRRTSAETSRVKEMTGVNVTNVNQAMGTPAYMPPEQSQDAAHVDNRADIYSLGCTFYVMVTAQPVHKGTTAAEVMSKHATEPVVRPNEIAQRVPESVSDIIMKMVAKDPDDRYPDMDDLIDDLEAFLGVDSTGPFTPTEKHAATLETSVELFNGSKAASVASKASVGFLVLCAVLMVLFALSGQGGWFGAVLGLGVLTSLCHFVLSGIMGKTHLFTKARQYVLGNSLGDWLMGLVGAIVLVVLLFMFGQLWVWLGVLVVSAAIASAFHFGLDRKATAEQELPISKMQEMLKTMRLRGMDEQAIQQFVCKYGGPRWEGLFEALFGYEAKLAARGRWGHDHRGQPRKKHGAWRDPVVRWMEARQKLRQQKKERKHLAAIERKALKAKGISEGEAQSRANRAAETMVDKAAELRTKVVKKKKVARIVEPVEPGDGTVAVKEPEPRTGRRASAKSFEQLLAEDADDAQAKRDAARSRSARPSGPVNFVLGARARFVVGAMLIAACAIWMHQNGMIGQGQSADELATTLKSAATETDIGTEALRLPLLPESVLVHFNSLNVGLAGLILVFSAFFPGVKMAFLMVPAAAVAMFGHRLGLGQIWVIPAEYVSMAAAGVLVVLGVLFGRRRSR